MDVALKWDWVGRVGKLSLTGAADLLIVPRCFFGHCLTCSCICKLFFISSIEHPDVLSEKINFSAPGGPKSAKFDPGHLDPICFEVGNKAAAGCATLGVQAQKMV